MQLTLRFIFLIYFFSLLQGTVFSQTIAAGSGHCMVVCPDSTVRAWGLNSYGQLGDSTIVNALTAVTVKNLTGVQSLSNAGVDHSLALKSDGTVWGWGINISGDLGDSTTTSRTIPVQVHGPGNIGFLTGITSLAGGHLHHHSMALKNDSTVWAWGLNIAGQLGDSTQITRLVPVKVKGLSKVVAIAAGDLHSMVLRDDGTVWAYGKNNNGQLGDSTNTDRILPVQVKGLSGIVAISAGELHSMALKNDGTVWCWGLNYHGQLGDGTNFDSNYPLQVTGLSGITAIAAGELHTLALKNDSTVWAWGLNFHGQLGDSSATDRWTPVQVKGLQGVIEVTGGRNHSLALKSDGTHWSWGMGTWGQLGDGSTGMPPCYCQRVPVQVWGPCNTTTEINEPEKEKMFEIVPNPSSGEFVVSGFQFPAEIIVYDLYGKKIFFGIATQEQKEINLSNAGSGVYFVQINAGERVDVKKLLISK